MVKEGSGYRAFLSAGALLGEPGGGGGAFARDPEGCGEEGSGKGHLSMWGPHWGA